MLKQLCDDGETAARRGLVYEHDSHAHEAPTRGDSRLLELPPGRVCRYATEAEAAEVSHVLIRKCRTRGGAATHAVPFPQHAQPIASVNAPERPDRDPDWAVASDRLHHPMSKQIRASSIDRGRPASGQIRYAPPIARRSVRRPCRLRYGRGRRSTMCRCRPQSA
jgi:hypothetical protein